MPALTFFLGLRWFVASVGGSRMRVSVASVAAAGVGGLRAGAGRGRPVLGGLGAACWGPRSGCGGRHSGSSRSPPLLAAGAVVVQEPVPPAVLAAGDAGVAAGAVLIGLPLGPRADQVPPTPWPVASPGAACPWRSGRPASRRG